MDTLIPARSHAWPVAGAALGKHRIATLDMLCSGFHTEDLL
jgi:hypothetical protein